jgi:hypothetical protein
MGFGESVKRQIKVYIANVLIAVFALMGDNITGFGSFV